MILRGVVAGIAGAIVCNLPCAAAATTLILTSDTTKNEESTDSPVGAEAAAGGASPPPDGGDNNDNNKKKDSGKQQDRMLTQKEIKEVEKALGEDIHDIKGGTNASKYDLYKRTDGEVVMKPKGGAGPGEPIGFKFPTGG